MRKLFIAIAVIAVVVSMAKADTFTATFAVTNSVPMTNTSVTVNGWIDRIEISSPNVSAGTYSAVVATYDAGGTAIDTFATVSGKTTSSTVIRPRVIGTSNAGTALTGTTNITGGIVQALYERPLAGGNTQILVSPASCTAGGTVTVSIYYLRPASQLVP